MLHVLLLYLVLLSHYLLTLLAHYSVTHVPYLQISLILFHFVTEMVFLIWL
jgi:hypothetical protein